MKKILIVDDQLGVRLLLEETLKEEGYVIDIATNGREAIEKAREFSPDLILMDFKMPVMNGITALESILAEGQQTKVIMMTAYGEGDICNQSPNISGADYIKKPFDINIVKDKVNKILE